MTGASRPTGGTSRGAGTASDVRCVTDRRRAPLPAARTCAYALQVLDALAHPPSRRPLCRDATVGPAVQRRDRPKLIDMGAVRRMDDADGTVCGTIGDQAPGTPRGEGATGGLAVLPARVRARAPRPVGNLRVSAVPVASSPTPRSVNWRRSARSLRLRTPSPHPTVRWERLVRERGGGRAAMPTGGRDTCTDGRQGRGPLPSVRALDERTRTVLAAERADRLLTGRARPGPRRTTGWSGRTVSAPRTWV